jgi:DEAD/DEAH box helicase domain-containing protein
MIQSTHHQVERLDWEGRKAFVTPTRADYYTDSIDYTRLKILERFEEAKQTQYAVAQVEVHLVKRIVGYKKIRYYSHENVGYGNIDLPGQGMHATAVWWQVNPQSLGVAFDSRQVALDGFLSAGYALHIIAAMHMLSEPRDIGLAVGDGNARWFVTVGANGRGQLRSPEDDAIDPAQMDHFTPTLFLCARTQGLVIRLRRGRKSAVPSPRSGRRLGRGEIQCSNLMRMLWKRATSGRPGSGCYSGH